MTRDTPRDEIERAVVECGTAAVLSYRDIAGLPDNEVPEVFIGSYSAPRLCESLKLRCRVERRYEVMAEDRGGGSRPFKWCRSCG